MRTEIITDCENPWLETYLPGNSRPEQIAIDMFPFTIGRNEEAEFTIPSSKVSRAHADIIRSGAGFALKDLGSTNGTFVNGAKIDEVQLQDGDVIVIADVELSFFVPNAAPAAANVTQVMNDSAAMNQTSVEDGPTDPIQEFILGLRRLQQMTTQRCVQCHFEPIVEFRDKTPFGYEVHSVFPASWQAGPRQIRQIECRLNERFRQLTRQFAAEYSSRLPEDTLLFFNVESSEVGVEWLPEQLSRLQETVAEFHRIVVEIPDSAVCDIPYFRDFVQRIRDQEILIAYDGFAGGVNQINEMGNIVPDYLKLSPTLVRGIDRSSGGQRQIQALVHAGEQMGCRVIATGVDDAGSAAVFEELGCELGQGAFLGHPQPLEELVNLVAALG